MSTTFHLSLPYLDAAQAQKHITHNQALTLLDACVHLYIEERYIEAPPATPLPGSRYLIGPSAQGDFKNKEGYLATFIDGGWLYLTPQPGWCAYIGAEKVLSLFDGKTWIDRPVEIKDLTNLSHFSLGGSLDQNNPFSVHLNSALFSALSNSEGGTGDVRLFLNKTSSTGTASHLYETAYAARAEAGLLGDDHYRIKVSADGNIWSHALDIHPATGVVSFPSGALGMGLTLRRTDILSGTGTYNVQPQDILYRLIAIGGGGGGGSGRVSATGAAAGGGSGGQPGAYVERFVPAAALRAFSPISYNVGTGGAGGPLAGALNTEGRAGGSGLPTQWGRWISAAGGSGGTGGSGNAAPVPTGSAAFVGGLSLPCRLDSGAGLGAFSTAATAGSDAWPCGPTGGGGGGGVSMANSVLNFGLGGAADTTFTGGTVRNSPAGGSAGLSAQFALAGTISGNGGNGGQASLAASGGTGGAGGFPGGGGGGGAGSRNGFASGAGGEGAAGTLMIEVYG